MGIFGKGKPADPPVRRDKVMNLIKLGMRETEEADRDIDSVEFDRAKAAFEGASANATKAEYLAAYEALKRHGY